MTTEVVKLSRRSLLTVGAALTLGGLVPLRANAA